MITSLLSAFVVIVAMHRQHDMRYPTFHFNIHDNQFAVFISLAELCSYQRMSDAIQCKLNECIHSGNMVSLASLMKVL